MNTAEFPSFPSDTTRNYVSLHLKGVDVSVLKRYNEYGRSTCKNMEMKCVGLCVSGSQYVCVCVRGASMHTCSLHFAGSSACVTAVKVCPRAFTTERKTNFAVLDFVQTAHLIRTDLS